jgi:ribonuclease E
MSGNEITPEAKPRRRAAGRPAGPPADVPAQVPASKAVTEKAPAKSAAAKKKAPAAKKVPISVPVFQSAPITEVGPAKKKTPAKQADGDEVISVAAKGQAKKRPAKKTAVTNEAQISEATPSEGAETGEERTGGNNRNRNRNRRGGKNKNRAKTGGKADENDADLDTESDDSSAESDDESTQTVSARKRSRTRTRDGSEGESGSTRLDAKRARRRDGRDSGRRRAPILTESEFLARRENVERVMVVRQQGARTQIAVLEDGIIVEHYINQSSSGSLVGNVYLGRVQNVLPGMEAAFVDIGKGRNAVLYAGEVNWDAAGLDGQPKKIETALKSGDPVLVQVTKDPVGQKGARLTSQISLPGRFLVYVPNNPMTGISRKLPDRERSRLKTILKAVVPEDGGVIVRTAAEGASEEELGRDVARLAAQWLDIEAKSKTASPPTMLYGEPDISIKVVRDIFNEDVKKLIVSGADAWETVEQYVSYVAPDLADRLEKYVGTTDVFTEHQIDEQIAKALDRKVYLPSGGSLVIDRTEAMTVVDVNTGKFIGSGGNLEQTVTKNNLEAAEEIVRQLRLRDIGGIIVIDFIDMVLESNRDQVIRRLIECLGRDRTKHQVAEVTSLGLVQMTRKRIGAGLLEVFSELCDHCQGRGAVVNMAGHDPEKTPKNKGKQSNHEHSHEAPAQESIESNPEEQVSV